MKSLLKITILLIFPLFIFSCQQQDELTGLWMVSYKQYKDREPEPIMKRTLFEFESDSLIIVSIGNFSTGDLSKVTTEKVSYLFNKSDSILKIKEDEFKISIREHIITLVFPDNPEKKFALNKLSNHNSQISYQCIKGSYAVFGESYNDSIDFINDSILLQTGEYNLFGPGIHWEIYSYKQYDFLNIHNEFFPLFQIKSCSENEILLEYHSNENNQLKFKKTTSEISPSDLIGKWKEIPDRLPRPPLPPGLTDEDKYYKIHIEKDTIIINYYRPQRLKWNLSNDGKKIYFIDKIFQKDGSWKILELTENKLTIQMAESIEGQIVHLKKE